MINNINEAFEILKNTVDCIPYEAIKFLKEQPADDRIISAIVSRIDDAYEKYGLDILWYAVIAESFQVKELIDPVLNLYYKKFDEWEMLNEQCRYVLGLLAEKYPDIVPEKSLLILEEQVKSNTIKPYYHLYEALYFLDIEKNKQRLLDLLNIRDFFFIGEYAVLLADLGIKEAVPLLEKQLVKVKNKKIEFDYINNDVKVSIDRLKGDSDSKTGTVGPYSKKRGEWENFYRQKKINFDNLPEEYYDGGEDITGDIFDAKNEKIEQYIAPEKPGRNEPCPCGSGKKYKKCCGK
jgi:hypothetical protein